MWASQGITRELERAARFSRLLDSYEGATAVFLSIFQSDLLLATFIFLTSAQIQLTSNLHFGQVFLINQFNNLPKPMDLNEVICIMMMGGVYNWHKITNIKLHDLSLSVIAPRTNGQQKASFDQEKEYQKKLFQRNIWKKCD